MFPTSARHEEVFVKFITVNLSIVIIYWGIRVYWEN